MAALTAAKAEIIAKLDAMKTEAEKKLEAVNGTIAALQEKDTQLEKISRSSRTTPTMSSPRPRSMPTRESPAPRIGHWQRSPL